MDDFKSALIGDLTSEDMRHSFEELLTQAKSILRQLGDGKTCLTGICPVYWSQPGVHMPTLLLRTALKQPDTPLYLHGHNSREREVY